MSYAASAPFRAAAAIALSLSLTAQAGAVTRIRSDLNTCATVQQTLIREGAAVVRYPSTRIANYLLYDRYVSPRTHCPWGERLVEHYVPAKDNRRCAVWKCEEVEPLFDFGDRLPRPR